MKLQSVINRKHEKIVWFDTAFPRYYKRFNNQLYYSDNLVDWKHSKGHDTIATHIIKDELGIDQ